MSKCRREVMDPCERLLGAAADQRPPLNKTPMYIRVGDVLDFGIDWKAWATANYALIKTSAWAAAGAPVASPSTPTLTDGLIDGNNQVTSTNCAGTAAGDIYYLENTVVFEKADGAPVAFADRTVKRRLEIRVVTG